MARTKSTLTPSSTYGHACTHCYRAKCRCVRVPNSEDCERCTRLNKRCRPSDSIRRRNAPSTNDESNSRISKLEDKMDMLLSTIQSSVGFLGSSSSSVDTFQSLGGGSLSSGTAYSNNAPANLGMGVNFSPGSTFASNHINTETATPDSLRLRNQGNLYMSVTAPLGSQVDDQLSFFRSRMLPSFPFIYFDRDVTAWALDETKPILLQAIKTVTTFSTKDRLVQAEELKHLIFTSALLKLDSNIDLLLGILTYLAWSTDPFLGRADLVSRLTMLAISVACDMRLFKAPSADAQLLMTITSGQSEESGETNKDTTIHQLLEKQRAVLACFILSSNISSHLGRPDAIRWTPQMGESLHILKRNATHASDEFFIFQVRLQLLKQKSDDIRQENEANPDLPQTHSVSASTPRLLYLKSLRKELQDLRSSFRSDVPELDILKTHADYVDLYINQLGYSMSPQSPPLNLSGRSGDNGLHLGFERLKCLWQSVESITSWLDGFHKVPCSALIGQPFHFWSQMILSITLLKYLSVLEDPDWDCQSVRGILNLISTVDKMLDKLDLCSQEPELQCDDHLIQYLSKLLSRSRMWTQARWDEAERTKRTDANSTQNEVSDHAGYSPIPDLDQMSWIHSMDLGDEKWFEEILGMPASLN